MPSDWLLALRYASLAALEASCTGPSHWAQYEGPVQEASNAANDAYLKANNQSDGMRSYGRMVDLLLAEQRAGEGDQSS